MPKCRVFPLVGSMIMETTVRIYRKWKGSKGTHIINKKENAIFYNITYIYARTNTVSPKTSVWFDIFPAFNRLNILLLIEICIYFYRNVITILSLSNLLSMTISNEKF